MCRLAGHKLIGFILLAWGVTLAAACAQDYPTKPIRIVVPTVPGGAGDFTARLVGQWLNSAWGHQVVIDNRPGAAGNIGANIVAKTAPDGYTLLMPITSFSINPSLYPKLPFDTLKDLEMIAQVAVGPLMLAVNPALPAASVSALINLAKAKPGQLNYATSGSGTSSHLAGELFKKMAGVDIVSVSYKGGGPALVDVMSGQIQMYFATVPAANELVKAGKLRGLAVTSLQRMPQLPAIPTVAESGLPGFEVIVWFAVLGPAGIPARITNNLNQVIVKVLQTNEARKRLASQGLVPGSGTPQELKIFLRSEIEKWGKIVREVGIKTE